MPDAKQRAEDALEHLRVFEQGALADVKRELRKIAGTDSDAEPAADAAEAEAPAAPAKSAK